jgi:predicted nucleotidyltransferase
MTPAALSAAVGSALEPVGAVRLAYVFGSRVVGTATPTSDLDVAVWFEPTLDDMGRGRAKLEIVAALTDRLAAVGERADVVDLERAWSAVSFRAIRDGVQAVCRDERERVRVEAFVARRYDDEAPRRALFRRAAEAAAERMGRG